MATIDFDPEDYLSEVRTEFLVAELDSRSKNVPRGQGDGDPPNFRYVEAAFIEAKALPDCPPAIKDLLWHVHGRALA